MTRLVVLTASGGGGGQPPPGGASPGPYDLRFGPLSFVTLADRVSETVGDGLEAIGSAIVAAERAPRGLKIKIPIHGPDRTHDKHDIGVRMRRQLRALFNNAQARLQGFYFVWEPDPELDGWLLAGSAELSETDPGISFGEFEMELNDVYIVGRPGTHRPGRRAIIGDRRSGLVPRDSRRLLYSTDFDDHPLPTEPLAIPGDVVDLVASGNRPIGTVTSGPIRGARRLWRFVVAAEGEVVSYRPDEVVLNDRYRYLNLDELGSVRIWDLSHATQYPPNPAGETTERSSDPDLYFRWERVYGDILTPDVPLAMDNGAVRVVWLGAAPDRGLAIEYWDSTVEHYVRIGRVLHAPNVREARVVEATLERGVLEWRAGRYGLRAILQRGWWGPRLESYDDGGETARLEFAPNLGATVTVTPQTPTWVWRVTTDDANQPALLWASGSNDEVTSTSPEVVTGVAATWARERVLVAQLGAPPGPGPAGLGSLSLVDARPVPVLVGRR